MKPSALGWLKAFMWFVCIFHVTVGLALNLNIGLKELVASGIYGASVDWSNAQFVYILKPLGAFMIALGVMAGVVARNPLAHTGIMYGFVMLFTLRALQRLVFMADTHAAFAIPPGRSMVNMGAMLVLAVSLLLLARASAAGSSRRQGSAHR